MRGIFRDQNQKRDLYHYLHGSTHITDKILGLTFRISPEAFFQVNTAGAETLYGTAIELGAVTPETTVLDICCGTGTIGLSFAKVGGVSQIEGLLFRNVIYSFILVMTKVG